MGKTKKRAPRKAPAVSRAKAKAKAKQASKIAEIRNLLVAAGFDSAAKQAIALGVNRSTAWAVLNRDDKAGPSATIIKRALSSPHLPVEVRRKIEEYIEEKGQGLYGHSARRAHAFNEEFAELT